MKFHQDTSEIFVPDNLPAKDALARTTHLCVVAHPDDIEMMAAGPILECFQRDDKWFTGVVVTDGRGSPRNGKYEKFTDEEMRLVRFREQRKAAIVGEYAAQMILDYSSEVVKDSRNSAPVSDIAAIIKAARPQVIFTHNLADKHETHVAVAVRVIAALRSLPENARPQKVYGCEVWRDLDWMPDDDKITFDLSEQENLQSALLGVYDSQISGGKRYDLASLARRRANATFLASHAVDDATGFSYAMDLTPLITNLDQDIREYIQSYVDRFSEEVRKTITRVL
ncbi:MAG: PIG-L family deacetylase [Anaerolineales bacterium]|jgi:LmbE family N-acetylglucosaminyl deacetylase